MRKAPWIVAALAGVTLAVGCGGSSTSTGDSGDEAGAGGDAGTGRGGSSNGGSDSGGSAFGGSSGSAVGGSSTGGIGAGGVISTGGIGTGGIGTGGIGTGGTGTSGTAGIAGAGGVCSLPLVTGNCNAYFRSFGFSTADGNCQPFVYGGCGGNDNRFSTLEECEATCGGSLSACPEKNPMTGTSCSQPGQICSYDYDNCLCSPTRMLSCPKIDEACTTPPPDGGISEIVVVLYTGCTCTNGTWDCRLVFSGGR